MKKKLTIFLTILVMCMVCSFNVFAAGELKDGTYSVTGTLAGGSHGISIKSPTTLTVKNGQMTLEVVMSSKNYTVMYVNGVEYDNETPGSNSTFIIPVSTLDTPISVSATTVAMSQPHNIDYTITLDSKSLPADAFAAEPESKDGTPTVIAPTTDTNISSSQEAVTDLGTAEQSSAEQLSNAVSSTEASSTETSSVEAPSTETSSIETSSTEASSTEASSTEASSTDASKEAIKDDNGGSNGTMIAIIVVVVVVVVGAAIIAVMAKKKIQK